MTQDDNYQKVVDSLKRRKKGATVADVCAATALSLHEVRELLPMAADEYSGHLKVTQSGEILYYFPDGFSSRYRGLGAGLKKAFGFCKNALKAASVFLFKVWIMVMLVGYFALFMAIALASVVLSVAAQSKSSNSGRRSMSFGTNLFGLIWRIWFYSEITRPRYGYGRVARNKTPGRPMHKAIFSFVFGEDDPNRDWEDRKNKAVITYLQANRGVISLAEYMAFTGENSIDAEKSILAFCSKYGGSPEVTEEGTVVYRFDELLLRADSGSFAELSPPVKRLKTFSFNSKSMNGWFTVINAVNLIFGSYFLFQSFAAGQLITEIQYQSASYLYAFTHLLMENIFLISEPHNFIRMILGFTPLLFSFFFWLIPLVRYFSEKNENGEIKLENFKRIAFGKIWSSPVNVETGNLVTQIPECRPENPVAAGDRAVKELGAISAVEVEVNEDGKTLYSFKELENEKRSIKKYRAALDTERSKLGDTVFDSGR